jgi:hypothetical protein
MVLMYFHLYKTAVVMQMKHTVVNNSTEYSNIQKVNSIIALTSNRNTLWEK